MGVFREALNFSCHFPYIYPRYSLFRWHRHALRTPVFNANAFQWLWHICNVMWKSIHRGMSAASAGFQEIIEIHFYVTQLFRIISLLLPLLLLLIKIEIMFFVFIQALFSRSVCFAALCRLCFAVALDGKKFQLPAC